MIKKIKYGLLAISALTALSAGTIAMTNIAKDNISTFNYITAHAEEEEEEITVVKNWNGSDMGTGLTAILTSDGKFTVSGNGAMKNWTSENIPAYSDYKSQIKTVVIGDGVTSIGGYSFSLCNHLEKVVIGNKVANIAADAFARSDELKEITVNSGNENYCVVNGVLFNAAQTTIVNYPASLEGSAYVIPQTVTTIGGYAFYDNKNLTQITVPEGVTTVGDFAFAYCAGITEMTLPQGVTTIGDRAFEGCVNMAQIVLPEGLTSIGKWALSYCESLTKIIVPEGVTTIGEYAFYHCGLVTKVFIPSTVTSIGNWAFHMCKELETINVNDNNENYSDNLGVLYNKNQTNLIYYPVNRVATTYSIPDGVTTINYASFVNCEDFIAVYIPKTVTNIASYAFQDCVDLTVYCETTQDDKPEGWQENWFTNESAIVWGHIHDYEIYVSDNNATCTSNCTESAACSSCPIIHTVEIEGTMAPHNYDSKHICVDCGAYVYVEPFYITIFKTIAMFVLTIFRLINIIINF